MSHQRRRGHVVFLIWGFGVWLSLCAGLSVTGARAADQQDPSEHTETDAPHAVLMIGEAEYDTADTLTQLAEQELIPRGIRCTFVHANPQNPNDFPGLEALEKADLLVISVRRRAISTAQMDVLKAYLSSGKPVVGIRTASHAFGREPADAHHVAWWAFDQEVLGAHYQGHHDNKPGRGDPPTVLDVPAEAANDPILRGVQFAGMVVDSHLYKNRDAAQTVRILMTGQVQGGEVIEPVTWTNDYQGARVFYTSLGSPSDFKIPSFRVLLVNGIYWALGKETPGKLLGEEG